MITDQFYAARLSRRQHDVMSRRARGMTIKEIADDLGITSQTVKNHFTMAYAKLGAENTSEAYVVLGWLTVPEYEEVA